MDHRSTNDDLLEAAKGLSDLPDSAFAGDPRLLDACRRVCAAIRPDVIRDLLDNAASLWVSEHGAPHPEDSVSSSGNKFLWEAESAYHRAIGR